MLQQLHENQESADFFASDDTPLSFSQLGATLVVPPLEEFECRQDDLLQLQMRLFVRAGKNIEELTLASQNRLVLGRLTPNSPYTPNVDLTDFNALQLGVSRLHAIIENHDNLFTITDLYSSNGTSLNGRRLEPNEIRFLHDGDTVCLGKLVIYVRICDSIDE